MSNFHSKPLISQRLGHLVGKNMNEILLFSHRAKE